MTLSLRQHVEIAASSMDVEYRPILNHYRDLQEFLMPRRGRFLMSDRNKLPTFTKVIDNTASMARRTLQSGMMAGITSPARPWFKLGVADKDLQEFPAVNKWLRDVRDLMSEIFASSNIYNSLHVMYGEEGVFGTGAMLTLSDFDNVIMGQTLTVGSYKIGVNDRGKVDMLYREIPLTVHQCVGRFGFDNVSQLVKDLYDRGAYSETVETYQMILPNPDRDPIKKDAKGKAFLSTYWERGSDSDKWLRMSGFDEFPAMIPRWEVLGGEPYGYGPGTIALGDTKQLQNEQKKKGQAISKMVSPPLLAPTSMRGEAITSLPGGVNYHDMVGNSAGIRSLYDVNFPVNYLTEDIREVQHRIDSAFYKDLFLMLATSDRRQITAREIEERHEEKLLMLGPVLERLHDELLNPLIDRTFNLMARAGILPVPPEEMRDQDIKVEYISMMAQAQKAVGAATIERTIAFAGNLVAVFPEIRHKVDAMAAVDEYAEMNGAPPNIIIPTKDAKMAADEEAKNMQRMAMMQQAESGAQSAKLLSETDTGDGKNAIQRMMGT